ncbi:hypothetical protein IWX91DRAFT_334941, partial [Phyllosticta citricarpa]
SPPNRVVISASVAETLAWPCCYPPRQGTLPTKNRHHGAQPPKPAGRKCRRGEAHIQNRTVGTFFFFPSPFAIDYLPSPSVPVHVLLAFSLCRNQAAVHRPRNIVGHTEPIYVGASQVPGKRCPEPEKSFLLFAKTYHKAAEPDLHSAAAYPSIRPSVQTNACGASGRRGARLRRTSARCRWTPSSLSCLVTLPARLPCHCRHGITRLSPRLVSPRLASFGWLARSLHVTLSVLSGLCVGPAPCIHWLACSFGCLVVHLARGGSQ